VKKPYYLVALILAGFIYIGSAIAAEEGQEEQQSMSSQTGDEVVAMCEEKFTADNYPDEEERNKLIDECINEKINSTD
jgi:hypothetical protein